MLVSGRYYGISVSWADDVVAGGWVFKASGGPAWVGSGAGMGDDDGDWGGGFHVEGVEEAGDGWGVGWVAEGEETGAAEGGGCHEDVEGFSGGGSGDADGVEPPDWAFAAAEWGFHAAIGLAEPVLEGVAEAAWADGRAEAPCVEVIGGGADGDGFAGAAEDPVADRADGPERGVDAVVRWEGVWGVGPEVGDDGDGDGFAAAARSAAWAGAEGVFAAGEPCADPFADDGAVDADDSGDGDAAGALLEEEDGLLAAFEEGFGRESAGVAQLDGHGVSEACGVPWRWESRSELRRC